MRRLLCGKCGSRPSLKIWEDEPGFVKRIMRGVARTPRLEDRVIKVNGTPVELDPAYFNCDDCNAKVKPGDAAVTLTMWRDGSNPIPPWESDCIEQAEDTGKSPGTPA